MIIVWIISQWLLVIAWIRVNSIESPFIRKVSWIFCRRRSFGWLLKWLSWAKILTFLQLDKITKISAQILSKEIDQFRNTWLRGLGESSWGSAMNNAFLLFSSPRPRSQVWILIYRKCSIFLYASCWRRNHPGSREGVAVYREKAMPF